MLKHIKRFTKKEPTKPREESASKPISPTGSRPAEHAGPSIVVPPTEAAIAAVNANKGYSGTVLASKMQDQQLISPRIPAGPVFQTPPAGSSAPGHVASSMVAQPSVEPLLASPQPISPNQVQKRLPQGVHSTAARAELSPPSVASYHAEASGASYTSSTGSARAKSHSPHAKDHKAALHAANERLQKALQLGTKHQPESAAAPQAAAPLPDSENSCTHSLQGYMSLLPLVVPVHCIAYTSYTPSTLVLHVTCK